MSDNKALSVREMELAVLAWRATVEEPKIDYNKLAEVANFKNSNSARANFTPLRKKLLEGAYAAFPTATPKGQPNATPKGKRNAAAAGGDGDDNPAPTKKPRGRAKKAVPAAPAAPAPAAPAPAAAPVKEEEKEEEQEEEEEEDGQADVQA